MRHRRHSLNVRASAMEVNLRMFDVAERRRTSSSGSMTPCVGLGADSAWPPHRCAMATLLQDIVAILAISNPLGALPVFLAVTERLSPAGRRRAAVRAA